MKPDALPLKPNLLPPEPGIWPLAPGWWLLLALLLALALWLGWRWLQRRKRYAANRWLQHQLRALIGQQLPANVFAASANRLLKQWALAQGCPASAQGQSFIGFLQSRLEDPARWTPELTELLLHQAYQGEARMTPEAVSRAQQALAVFARSARPEVNRVQF